MVSDDRLIQGTVNQGLSTGNGLAQHRLRAAGKTPIDGQDQNDLAARGSYNGGIVAARVSRLQKGDLLFRFSNIEKTDLEARFAGDWWFSRDCLATIRWAARMENSDFREAARSYLGIVWGDSQNLVGGLLNADFWCFTGLTGAVEGEGRRMSGPLRTDVVQIYVPGGLRLSDFTQPRDNVLTSGIV